MYGEPGVSSHDMPTAAELATLLVDRFLTETPTGATDHVVVMLNGLGPEIGELVTSLDMAGCSLTMMWLDADLL